MIRKSIEIARQLELAILQGEFAPGTVLDEMALATRFAASRTPVREALVSIAASGLIELRRGSGALVVGISLDTLFEGYEVFANSLGFACALSAARMTPRQRVELRGVLDEMADRTEADGRDAYIVLEEQLHDAILTGAANSLLALQVRRCKQRIAAVREASMRSHPSVAHVIPELRRIVDAIDAGDAEAARRNCEAHIALRGDGARSLAAHWQRIHQAA